MLVKMRWMRTCFVAAFTLSCIVLGMAGSADAVDDQTLERMERLIQQQQAQIEAQAKALEKLQQQMETLSEKAVQQATEAAKTEVAKTTTASPDVVRNKGGDKVSIKVYGHANRAFLAADDGDSSDYYFVDNDNSSTRVGILGEAKINEDLTLGSRFEFEYQSNPSNVVNQDDKNPDGTSFDDRWIDAQLTSKRFGKLYIGKGDTASNGTSEVDLSGTSVVGYSSIGDMAGGILFYDDNSDSRSGTDVGDAFSNFDGLSRRNRVRYDSPTFWGFKLSGSLLSDGGDVALNYAAKWGEDWTFAGALAYADPQAVDRDVDHQYNGSASILHSSGLNLTVAGGLQDLDESGRDDPTFYYAKVGYRADLFKFGETRFSVDYTRNDDYDLDNDEANSFGAQIVQDFPKWGSEYYIGYRWHELDRDVDADGNLVDYDDIQAVMTGVRVKF